MIFGVTTPLASWNPLWADPQVYASSRSVRGRGTG